MYAEYDGPPFCSPFTSPDAEPAESGVIKFVGAEALGTADADVDADVLGAALAVLDAVGADAAVDPVVVGVELFTLDVVVVGGAPVVPPPPSPHAPSIPAARTNGRARLAHRKLESFEGRAGRRRTIGSERVARSGPSRTAEVRVTLPDL